MGQRCSKIIGNEVEEGDAIRLAVGKTDSCYNAELIQRLKARLDRKTSKINATHKVVSNAEPPFRVEDFMAGGETTPFMPSRLQVYSRLSKGDVADYYDIQDHILGSGFSGSVLLATRNGKQYAVKTFNKSSTPAHTLYNEVNIYLMLDHPHITRLLEVYEDKTKMSLVMEYCSGGDLLTRLSNKQAFCEATSRTLTIQMLSALQYLHSHSVVHRDIKLQNWLYSTPEDDSPIKLIDFGFSRIWNPEFVDDMKAVCGTLTYTSPDVLRGNYTNACDMWSLGIMVFMLLTGASPFPANLNKSEKVMKILSGDLVLNIPSFCACSTAVKSFVLQLLVVDPSKRMTALEAMNHPWLAPGLIAPPKIDHFFLLCLKKFSEFKRFRRFALFVMALFFSEPCIDAIKDSFLALDLSREGTIRLRELSLALRDTLDLPSEKILDIFRSLDSSGDQEIFFSDFLAVVLAFNCKIREGLLKQTFDKLDWDNTGWISLNNIKHVIGDVFMGMPIEDMIREIDVNGTGKIDYDMFCASLSEDSNDAVMDINDSFVSAESSLQLVIN